jgi:hypothetical protein
MRLANSARLWTGKHHRDQGPGYEASGAVGVAFACDPPLSLQPFRPSLLLFLRVLSPSEPHSRPNPES